MGVLDGIKVLDLSSGISGPMAGMLLADQGATVTKIEPPGGDPWRALSGSRVWNRGKRSAVIDLRSDAGRARVQALAGAADVVIESYDAGTAARFGVDYETLRAGNPRLIHCSITGYAPDSPDAGRPPIDALVAARTGQQWEVRGTPGGILARIAGTEGMMPGIEMPDNCWSGPDREGPLFTGVPWVSVGTFYLAVVGINAALRARELTGEGQAIQASLYDGAVATLLGGWQKVPDPNVEFFTTWVFDSRAPKGFFQGSDGRWMHHWVPLPDFILSAGEKGIDAEGLPGPRQASTRISTQPDDMVILHAMQQQMADAVAKYPADDWVRAASRAGVPVQRVRSPEEALLDEKLVEDGCVTEVDDPEVGPIRQVGRVVDLARHPAAELRPAPAPGQDTAEVVAEADALLAAGAPAQAARGGRSLPAPLDGVTVLDLGLAVAGPFGTQVLAQLGARVIKVTAVRDEFWFSNHIAMCCNRDKESITLNLKDPEAMSVLHRLVERADVVQHNMRYEAAERLGVDYESLRQLNPRLVYCHTMGHDRGPRAQDPGNDQTGAALAGTTWLDGGLDNGGRPVWSCTSLGDTGNGFLSALGIIQALYDRDRTGEGQFVRTSITYAHLLNSSIAWISPDGTRKADRPSLDAEGYGWNALYRLYNTAEGWLCLAAFAPAAWDALCRVIGGADVATDARFATAEARRAHDGELAALLAAVFAERTAVEWFAALDGAGVPCEISDPDYAPRLFADPAAEERGTVVSLHHHKLGDMKMAGLGFHLSGTPGKIWGPPVWPGQHSGKILDELGYTPDEIAKLVASGAVKDTADS